MTCRDQLFKLLADFARAERAIIEARQRGATAEQIEECKELSRITADTFEYHLRQLMKSS